MPSPNRDGWSRAALVPNAGGRIRREDADRTIWSEEQVRKFIAAVAAGRLSTLWLLSLLGLRRAEVFGLKWSDVSFTDGTLTIARTRVLVNSGVIEKCPEEQAVIADAAAVRAVTSALEALYAVQGAEKAEAGRRLPRRRGWQLRRCRRIGPAASPGEVLRRVRPALP